MVPAMLTRLLSAAFLAGLTGLLVAMAQPPKEAPAPATGDVDAVTREAAALEAQLARASSTSPEGAEVMLKLINLYHTNARPFGLVQVAQSFVTLHTTHARHREVMLKLIDGLMVVGRNKEVIAAGRQFVARNPSDPACVDVDRWLARLLKRTGDNAGYAAVSEAQWKRLGATPEGRRAGREAVTTYLTLNTPDTLNKAAVLAEEMFAKLPAGEAATAAGIAAMDAYERRNEWAKAALVGAKLLVKSPPTLPYPLQALHVRLASDYSQLTQRANAAASLRSALAVKGVPSRPDLMIRLISELNQSAAKPAEIEPLVADYIKNSTDRTDGPAQRTLVAQAYLAAKQPEKAEPILIEVMPRDARSNNAVGLYLTLLGTDAKKLAEGEKVLRGAIAKSTSPLNSAALRYSLAIELLRDRIKDTAKAKTEAAELVYRNTTGDGLTSAAATWLLDAAADDDEFKVTLARILEARQKQPWHGSLRNVLGIWLRNKAALKDKGIATRLKLVRDELAKADADPRVTAWTAYAKSAVDNSPAANIAQIRAKLMAPEALATYPDAVAEELLSQQFAFNRGLGAARQAIAVEIAKRWTERLPKSRDAATAYLNVATDLVVTAEYSGAVQAMLTFEPSRLTDHYRRIMLAASGAKNADLGKKAWAWVKNGYDKFGYDGFYASTIGEYLYGLGLKEEANDCWRRCVANGNPDAGDFRDCSWRLMVAATEPEKIKMLDALLKRDTAWRFGYATARADSEIKARQTEAALKLVNEAYERQADRAVGGITNVNSEWSTLSSWVSQYRSDAKLGADQKGKLFTAIRALKIPRASMTATAAQLELPDDAGEKLTPMARLFRLAEATQLGFADATDFDALLPYAQAAMGRKDYMAAGTLAAGMLANSTSIDEARRKTGRDLLASAYTRLGALGGTVIDETSPLAPLFQAALQLRLGDPKLAFETYLAHQKLFDENRSAVPVDLLAFVCENHMAAGGDENHNRVEDILRDWLIKNSDSQELDAVEKARVQLLLARNYYRSKRFDLARAEFTTLLNRYKNTPQVVEAEFGIGETFMEQKVFDQAEQAFEKLAGRRERDVVIRAEFLRGVLASRRGDRDEARLIFRSVLERVPNVELANQALFNLSEVYGSEQRYVDQLELLRTVGRLGRASKRWHTPGESLSIVVQDSDLGISRGHNRIPVKVTTEPGGDEETVYLLSGGAGKGLFRTDVETTLGTATKGDRILQLTGKDIIRVDYPEEFKKEFKDVHLPDAEIRIAADAKLDMASSKIVDETEETISQQLAREAADTDEPKSNTRPKNQVRPGNMIYLRVKDADRDISDQPDKIQVKLAAASGDQVTATLTETGSHTGIFEGTSPTGDLPAGAQATNTAIDHSPLMAIDNDSKTFWLSEPDGATPKALIADLKDLKRVDRVAVSTPDAKNQAPVRMSLEGSDDGRIWYRLASTPADPPMPMVHWESGAMTTRVFNGIRPNSIATWADVVALARSGTVESESKAVELIWNRDVDEKPRRQHAVIWHGKVVQPREGAVRILVTGDLTALSVDGKLELPVGKGNRPADLYLTRGTHDVTIFASAVQGSNTLEAKWAHAEGQATLTLDSFKADDFDIARPDAKPAAPRPLGEGVANAEGTTWEFKFPPIEVRYVRVNVHEYRGVAVAINHMEIADSEKKVLHIPTDADLLSLATNDTLEIAGGDVVTAIYIDDANSTGNSRLLNSKLTATFHNGLIAPIAYAFSKAGNGQVLTSRKGLLRIDPGERIVVEVTDFDQDATAGRDKVKISVAVNDGSPLELEATETEANTGVFTKEVDTAAAASDGKLAVKPGDRVYLRYTDAQNTIPGHAAVREAVVYVNQPTIAKVRVIESRALRSKGLLAEAPPLPTYLPPRSDADPAKPVGVAIEAPFSIEVIDPDAAKTSASTTIVTLTTSNGSKLDVECVLHDLRLDTPVKGVNTARRQNLHAALEAGRFTGQVIMQLGGKDSPVEVPLNSSMPRSLIGGPKIASEEGEAAKNERSIVAHVLNLSGADTVTATYVDKLRPNGPATPLTASGRLLTDGKLTITDAEFQKAMTSAHVGERLFLKVEDADQDRTPERDVVKVIITSKRGEQETVELVETLAHSGIFTASVQLTAAEKPTPGNLKPAASEIEAFFGDTLELVYTDDRAASTDGTLTSTASIGIIIGTDGKIQAFSKSYADENLAVETQFHIAESHFELFKSHKTLGREEDAKADLEAGRRVLREVMEDYPNPRYAPRVAYLFGQFAQELGQHAEAIQAYQLIVKQYPDHTLAPDAQFKLAQCYEEAKDFEQALEAYVTLAATYPKHPLIANVMVRISEHFYQSENFKVAAQVGEKFLERFEGHKWSPKMGFRIGQCFYKDKEYVKAAAAFDRFAKQFHDDPLGPDSMFWAGESFRTGGNTREAFHRYNKCRWDYPSSEAAKYSRGRLALPEMLRQFESEAAALEKEK